MSNPTPTGRRRARPAASAVEFAFVAPLLFMMVLGVIEVGRGIMVVHLLKVTLRLDNTAGGNGPLGLSSARSWG
jgi:hypothetical protein